MGALSNARYELFAQAIVRGMPASHAYVAAGYSPNGAEKLAPRVMANDVVEARIAELQAALERNFIVGEIGRREARIAALNERWLKCKALIRARAIEHANIPGGATGLLVRRTKREGDEYLFDKALLEEMRAIEQQAAQELGQWAVPEQQPMVPAGGSGAPRGFVGTLDVLMVKLERFTGEVKS